MSALRCLSASLLSALSGFSIVTASGCGTEAIGLDDCRDIEQARCVAGKPCGLVDDVDACRRYYRDHCLHGLSASAPAGASVAACVSVIQAAGRCAEESSELDLAECTEQVTEPRGGLRRACDVVMHPERASECAFLAPEPAEVEGAGGSPAEDVTGGATSGASGQTAGGVGN